MRSSLTFRDGLKGGLPIALAYLSVSFGFGIQAAQAALSPLTAALISLTNVTSAGQLAGLTIIAAGGSLMELMLAEFVINIRYALMSVSLTQKLDDSFTTLPRLICSFSMTDELYAVAASSRGCIGKTYVYGLMLLPVPAWALGTWLGAAAGAILPRALNAAMGVALYAMFLAIILPPSTKSRAIALCVAVAALLSCAITWIPFFSFITPGFSVVLCALLAAVPAAYFFPLKDEDEEGGDAR